MRYTKAIRIIRLLARIIGTFLVTICLLIFVGNLIAGSVAGSGMETYNVILFAVLGVGLAALILAWWKEGLGGFISLLSFIVFNLLAAFSPVEGSRYLIILLIFLIPSILYLICWWQQREDS